MFCRVMVCFKLGLGASATFDQFEKYSAGPVIKRQNWPLFIPAFCMEKFEREEHKNVLHVFSAPGWPQFG